MSRYDLLASFAGFDDFLIYLGLAALLLFVFMAIYVRITPYREMSLIRDGNTAAAVSLSGTIIGMVLPLASALEYSVSLIDLGVWATIALVVQILVFVGARITLPNIVHDIPAGKMASGIFLAAISVAAGLLNAAAMSY
jgi:putative membrane protein